MDLAAAYHLATALLAEHGLGDWSIRYDNAKRRAGVCKYAQRTIGLSAPLTRLHSEAEVRDTILHEIAHALVGPAHRHDEIWRQTAVRIGCSGERCVPQDAPRVAGAWLGVCSGGHTAERHTRPERVVSCNRCSDRFDPSHVFTWTFQGRPAAMHPNYLAELEATRIGAPVVRAAVRSTVRITRGDFSGRVGTVVKRGRTRYQVRLPEGIVRPLFSAVEPN